jgi:hypothetical protein
VTGTPRNDSRACARYSRYRDLNPAHSASAHGRFLFGTAKFAVRWNTYRCSATAAISGATWIPEDPVPTRPTRLPVKSTPSVGHRDVWYQGPSNSASPGRSGTWNSDRHPAAETRYRAVTVPPSDVATAHEAESASHAAPVTRVFSWMLGHSPNLSATWLRYRRISGCAGYRSLQDHSCSSSGEKEYE